MAMEVPLWYFFRTETQTVFLLLEAQFFITLGEENLPK